MWDLHHYFRAKISESRIEKLDLQFDISFFKDFNLTEKLPSYNAADHGGRLPDLVINVLSKSTWRKDLLDNVQYCETIKIPFYAVFFAYPVAPLTMPPPFLRVYELQENGVYKKKEVKKAMYKGGKLVDSNAFINLEPRLDVGIALEELDLKYLGGKEIFQAVIIDLKSKKKYLTRAEKEKARADELQRKIHELQRENQ
mgnify:CR=1 FL=1